MIMHVRSSSRLRTARRLLAAGALAAMSLAALAQDAAIFKIVAKDGRLEPSEITVPAGKQIKLEISNEGKTPIEFESKVLKVEKVLAPGAKSSVVIYPLKPGEYPFLDDFHPGTSKGKLIAK
jgi:plastocyanin